MNLTLWAQVQRRWEVRFNQAWDLAERDKLRKRQRLKQEWENDWHYDPSALGKREVRLGRG